MATRKATPRKTAQRKTTVLGRKPNGRFAKAGAPGTKHVVVTRRKAS
jgi:hypothetical protein